MNKILSAILVICILLTSFLSISWGIKDFGSVEVISLEYSNIPSYLLTTTVRILIAMIFAVVFSFIYATLAAKNKTLETILIPALDILQSIPILGYISFTVTFFVTFFPKIGFDLAAIFAIFTSQVWNMILSVYQSLKTVPKELYEASKVFKFNFLERYFFVEVPYTIPGLIWNMTLSMSGGWFFIVASECISFGDKSFNLPGIGSYIFEALKQGNSNAIFLSILAISIIIILYNQIIFIPLMAWSDKFKYESTKSKNRSSWFLNLIYKSNLLPKFNFGRLPSFKLINFPSFNPFIWNLLVVILIIYFTHNIYANTQISYQDIKDVFLLTFYTFLRVFIPIILVSVFIVPLGIFIGLKCSEVGQSIVQFFTSFPINILFPVAATLITKYNLDPEIWVSLLMMISGQWYILFNIIAGTSQIPTEFKDVPKVFNIGVITTLKKIILPALLPYYLTGAITATGAAWNASIIAEYITWKDHTISAYGIGSYISQMTIKGDFTHITLGIFAMSFFIIFLNKIFWQPINKIVIKKYSL